MEQGRFGDGHGNLTVSAVESKTVDVTVADFIWLTGYDTPFNLKLEAAGKLVVALANETDAQAKLMPFHEGWNSERVRKVFTSGTNVIDGLIIAGR